MLYTDSFSYTLSFAFFAPLLKISDISVKLVDVLDEQLDSFALRLLLTIGVYLSFESGNSTVSKLRVPAGLAS